MKYTFKYIYIYTYIYTSSCTAKVLFLASWVERGWTKRKRRDFAQPLANSRNWSWDRTRYWSRVPATGAFQIRFWHQRMEKIWQG